MKQISLASGAFEIKIKATQVRAFLGEMHRVVRWSELVDLIAPHISATVP